MKKLINRFLGDYWYARQSENGKWGIYHCWRHHTWNYPYDTKQEAQSQANFLNKLI